jgi:hypothetical protein
MESSLRQDDGRVTVGYSTHYLGGLSIRPQLNQAEVQWLRALCRWSPGPEASDPYGVPMNPGGDGVPTVVVQGRFGSCDWEPTVTGTHLRWVRREKSNDAAAEILYLIDHFLRPGAHAATSGRAQFADFSFDHMVSGVIAAERDDGRLWLITVADNVVSESLITAGHDDGLW